MFLFGNFPILSWLDLSIFSVGHVGSGWLGSSGSLGSVGEGDSFSTEDPSAVDVFLRLKVVECERAEDFEFPGSRTVCTWSVIFVLV